MKIKSVLLAGAIALASFPVLAQSKVENAITLWAAAEFAELYCPSVRINRWRLEAVLLDAHVLPPSLGRYGPYAGLIKNTIDGLRLGGPAACPMLQRRDAGLGVFQ